MILKMSAQGFMDIIKKNCQIFTPHESVTKLLDVIKYSNNLYGKKILENACGDGQILIQVVERYIADCRKNKISDNDIKKGLECDVAGYEIDIIPYSKCLGTLEQIANKNNLYNINWNIKNEDFLKANIKGMYDFVIGNPPYITYVDLDHATRMYLKNNYFVCEHGKFDYCYAFIEASIKALKNMGLMSYLIPNSIFKTVFGNKLRQYMLPHLTTIYDYSSKKLFANAITCSAIIKVVKNTNIKTIKYHNIVQKKTHNVIRKTLSSKWVFSPQEQNLSTNSFGDLFKASHAVATLLNKIFVFKPKDENEKYFILEDNSMIEKAVCKQAASPKHLALNKSEYIIFPYTFNNNTIKKLDEDELAINFPKTYDYFLKHKGILLKRDIDSSAKWFHYGRSQAIAQLNQPKLLMSSIATHKVHVYELDKGHIPYAGIYIIPRRHLDLDVAKKILKSDDFFSYIQLIGINASGESLRITSQDINSFQFHSKILTNTKL